MPDEITIDVQGLQCDTCKAVGTRIGNAVMITHAPLCDEMAEVQEVVRNQGAMISDQRNRIEQFEEMADELQSRVCALEERREDDDAAHDADLPKQARREPHG